jgi:hypothetical protein
MTVPTLHPHLINSDTFLEMCRFLVLLGRAFAPWSLPLIICQDHPLPRCRSFLVHALPKYVRVIYVIHFPVHCCTYTQHVMQGSH